MTTDEVGPVLVEERRRLLALGYRMLGTTADAEDAVQETYARWYRMTEAERAAVRNPQGWLTRVMSRVCLDVIGSARVRRERYVGEWLPEPVPTGFFAPVGAEPAPDPAERVVVDDEVSTALLVVMDAMTPAERVAFVLHDVFAVPFDEIAATLARSPAAARQLAASARRRVREHGRDRVDRRTHDAVVAAFGRAAHAGDLAGLTALLDPGITLVADGGGVVGAARRPVLGVSHVARFLLGVMAKPPTATLRPVRTGDGLAYAVVDPAGTLRALLNLAVRDGRVTDVWLQVNPHKLTAWVQPRT